MGKQKFKKESERCVTLSSHGMPTKRMASWLHAPSRLWGAPKEVRMQGTDEKEQQQSVRLEGLQEQIPVCRQAVDSGRLRREQEPLSVVPLES